VTTTVSVRRRGDKIYFSDEGAGVEAAGKPSGWYAVASRIVEQEFWLGINRRGVISVSSPVSRGREWLDYLERRVAEASTAVYEALLELDD